MKKLFSITLIALLGVAAPAFAQSKVERGAKKAWHGTKQGARKAGHKTAELSSKGVSNITNRRSDEWMGPEGQTIYVDDGNKYYWVNGRGKRIYVSESALRARNR